MGTTTKDSRLLTGLFNDRESAERAYQGLSQRGYTTDDINLVMSDDTRKRHFGKDSGAKTELGNKAAEGAGIGGAIGGTLGAALAAVTAVGTNLVLPGLGLVVAGPLAAAAAGAGAGAASGGLLGALIGWGIPEERVKHYESGIKQGGILMGVTPRSDDDAQFIENHWRTNNGQHIYRSDSDYADTADTGYTNRDYATTSASGTSAGAGSGHAVVGVYDNYADAQSAVQALQTEGFSRSNIHLDPETEQAGSTTAATDTTRTGEQESGIGHFFRSLFGSDDHAEHRDVYSESVRRGSYVLTVDALDDDQADRASDILNRFHAIDVDERSSQWKQQGWSGSDTSASRLSQDQTTRDQSAYQATTNQARTNDTSEASRIPVIEEELKVGKRAVQRGGVRIFQRVREIPARESVELRQEQVKVERHRVDKPATEADLAAFKEGSIELRETSEEAVVSKTARVVEEVVVGKQVTERTEEINDTVRRTDVEVEQLGAGTTASANTTGTTVDDADYRRHWQSAYGQSGERYEDYDAAYRYGSTMAGSGQYKNYQWNDVEPQLRSDWESNHPGSTWEKVKDAVRYGAERVTGGRRH